MKSAQIHTQVSADAGACLDEIAAQAGVSRSMLAGLILEELAPRIASVRVRRGVAIELKRESAASGPAGQVPRGALRAAGQEG